tara:strand:- start:19 stop:621 length:603 start_codon:yes stop_codon:yes gene_type:complete
VEQKYKTREEWLVSSLSLINQEVFIPAGRELPSNIMIACSFALSGNRLGAKKITEGTCFDKSLSANKENHQIIITPLIDDPVKVLDIVVHECLHAQVGVACGHKGDFVTGMKDIGLTGKPTIAHANPELLVKLEGISDQLGAYPHSRLDTTGRKKQSTRMIKCQCPNPDCGMVGRFSRGALKNGPPHCWNPEHGPMEIVD